MIKLIIFDVDGVLEKEDLIERKRRENLILHLSKKLKLSIDKTKIKIEEVKNTLLIEKQNTTTYLFIKLGFTRKEIFEIINEVSPVGLIEPENNCLEVLNTLKLNKKLKLVTYSNTPKKSSIRSLKTLKIDRYFSMIYSSEDFNESKPSKENLKQILIENNINIENVISIGNSFEKDIIPAFELGIKTIFYDPKEIFKEKPEECDYIIRDLIEILDII